jgi:hypothetical protein
VAPESYDPQDLVTIDAYDVDPAGLSGEGAPWSVVLPRDVDDRIGSDVSELLPSSGWRELSSPSMPPGHRVRLFAAPRDEGWALAYLSPNGILSADPGPLAVRPSRATRRAGLVLAWTVATVTAADVLGLTVTLTNTSDRRWAVDPDDHGYVHGWLISEGRRSGSDSFAYAPLRHVLHDLEPGESLTLAVDFGPMQGVPEPGAYEVEAVLSSLDVWTRRHPLVVV